MLPYLVLIFLPIAFLFVSAYKQEERWIITVGFDKKTRDNSLLIAVFFILFLLILILRHESIGVDLVGYRRHFRAISGMTFKQTLNREGDVLYNILNYT